MSAPDGRLSILDLPGVVTLLYTHVHIALCYLERKSRWVCLCAICGANRRGA